MATKKAAIKKAVAAPAQFNVCAGGGLIIDTGLLAAFQKAAAVPKEKLKTLTINGVTHFEIFFDAPVDTLIQPTFTVFKQELKEIAQLTLTLEPDNRPKP